VDSAPHCESLDHSPAKTCRYVCQFVHRVFVKRTVEGEKWPHGLVLRDRAEGVSSLEGESYFAEGSKHANTLRDPCLDSGKSHAPRRQTHRSPSVASLTDFYTSQGTLLLEDGLSVVCHAV
jgi:hypothetical protein